MTSPTPPSPILLADPDTSPGPFEGPEKLLEIWFAPSSQALPDEDDLPESSLSGSLRMRSPALHADAEGNGDIKTGAGQRGYKGLRKVPREVWEEMLDIVKCKVLSVVEGDELDAYLLSESSLFVAPHLLILKTCGTTLNLLGLYRIIEIARQYCGFTNVWRCFYSRKSFFFPERQHGIHKDWRDEVRFLDSVFGSAGSAYTVGPMNRDHWLLYLTSPNSQPLLPSDSRLSLPPTPSTASNKIFPNRVPEFPPSVSTPTSLLPAKYQDQTLEILMSYLQPAAREPFFHPDSNPTSSRSGHELGNSITTKLGIDKLFPEGETTIDSFGFEPCGYSANAVIGSGMPESSAHGDDSKPGGGYFTIHVTPEEGWSYASFECNVPLPIDSSSAASSPITEVSRPTLQTLIRNVVNIFQPNRLSITLFVSTSASASSTDDHASPAESKAWQAFGADLLGGEFERKDRIGYEFDGYDLVFGCFERKGWVEPKGNGVEGRLAALSV